MTLLDIAEIGGSVLILLAFAASQAGRWSPHSVAYLAFNLAGSAVLAVIALTHQSWGFLLLEGTWALVSAYALIKRAPRPHRPPSGH
jgi:hypothetical protein